MKPSPQQDQALKAVSTWLKDPAAKQTFYLAGYAGGKTTLARRLAEDIGRVCFGAFTGKAALVLRSKGCEDASTLHSLIYKIENPNSPIPRFVKTTIAQFAFPTSLSWTKFRWLAKNSAAIFYHLAREYLFSAILRSFRRSRARAFHRRRSRFHAYGGSPAGGRQSNYRYVDEGSAT